jgi:CDK-activating kinase assembly factor MAT1
MSRNSISKASGDSPSDDICPVCKSNRYLNPSLQFLINPECYHKMCSTCVDRIFTSGPASCPVPHCGKTLRKKGFHKAFFADLKIEREVDVRRRVAAVFNRREDEFETLRDWNNYLQEVEDLTFDIVQGDPKERQQAEERLKAYREGNKREIEENRRAAQEDAEMERLRMKEEEDAAVERGLAARREKAEEIADVANARRDAINRLATSDGDANKIAMQAQKVILKKTSARRNLPLDSKVKPNGNLGGLTIRGLKKKASPVVEKPYDPFGGLDMAPSRYVLQDDYDNEWLRRAKDDPRHMAGGYSMQEYYSRAMFDAFAGLGVFIEDEKDGDRDQSPSPGIATAAVAEAPTLKIKIEHKMDLDDVF